MTKYQFTTTVLTPAIGMYLTQSDNVHISKRVIATQVAIGENSSSAEWIEIDDVQRKFYLDELEAYHACSYENTDQSYDVE